jgi:hypothetical protein
VDLVLLFKSEIRSTKSETNSNVQNIKFKTECIFRLDSGLNPE